MRKKIITRSLRFEPELDKQISELAAKNNRSFSNMVETILKQHLPIVSSEIVVKQEDGTYISLDEYRLLSDLEDNQ